MSSSSRKRAAFAFGNADNPTHDDGVGWYSMIVLTWHYAPSGIYDVLSPKTGRLVRRNAVKESLKRLARVWLKTWGESLPAWIMEIQRRGVPHYHLFVEGGSAFGQQCRANVEGGLCEQFTRKGEVRTVVRGNLDRWLVSAWMTASRQEADPLALSFHEGGIIEIFDTPDAAGRYVAKESSKREQKALPPCYEKGLGRWWHLAPHLRPRPRRKGFVSLDHWPFPRPFSHIWETGQLGASDWGSWPVADDAAARALADADGSLSPSEVDAILTFAIRRRNESQCSPPLAKGIPLSTSEQEERFSEAVASMHLRLLSLRGLGKPFRPLQNNS